VTERPRNVPETATWSDAQQAWIEGSTTGGRVCYFRADGTPWCEYTYEAGVLHGPYRRYHETGEVACSGTMERGQFAGVHTHVRASGPSSEPFPSPFGELVQRIEIEFEGGRQIAQRFFDASGAQLDNATLIAGLQQAHPHVAQVLADSTPAEFAPPRPAGIPTNAEYKNAYWRVEQIIDGVKHVTRWTPDGAKITESTWIGEVMRSYTALRAGAPSSHAETTNGITRYLTRYPEGTPWHSTTSRPSGGDDDDTLIEQQLYMRDGTLLHHVRNQLDANGDIVAHREDGPGGVVRFENVVAPDGVRELRLHEPRCTLRLTEPIVVHCAGQAIALADFEPGWDAATRRHDVDVFALGCALYNKLVPTMTAPPVVTRLVERHRWASAHFDEDPPFTPATVRDCLIAVTSPIPLVAEIGRAGLNGGAAEHVDAIVETLLALPGTAGVHDALAMLLSRQPVSVATAQKVIASALPLTVTARGVLSLIDGKAKRAAFEAVLASKNPALRLVGIQAAAVVHGREARGWLEPLLQRMPRGAELEASYAALAIGAIEEAFEAIGDHLGSAAILRPLLEIAATRPAALNRGVNTTVLRLLQDAGSGATTRDAINWLRLLAAGIGAQVAAPVVDGLPAGAHRLLALARQIEHDGLGVLAQLQPVIGTVALPSGTLVLVDFKALGAKNPWLGEEATTAIARARASGEQHLEIPTQYTSADVFLDLLARTRCDVIGHYEDGELVAVSLVLDATQPVTRRRVGRLGAENGRFLIADASTLHDFWTGDVARDGRFDVVFWGPNAPSLAAKLGAGVAYPNDSADSYYGWTDLAPGDLYLPILTEIENGHVSNEQRPHNDQHRFLRTMWSSPTGAATAQLAGMDAFAMFTPHRGNYDILLEHAEDGRACRVTIVLEGDDDDEGDDDE
jgi:hypothetical protein